MDSIFPISAPMYAAVEAPQNIAKKGEDAEAQGVSQIKELEESKRVDFPRPTYSPEHYYIVIDLKNPLAPPRTLLKPQYYLNSVEAENEKAQAYTRNSHLYEMLVFSKLRLNDRYLAIDPQNPSFKRFLKNKTVEGMQICRMREKCEKFLTQIFAAPIIPQAGGSDTGPARYIILDLKEPLANSESILKLDKEREYGASLFSNPGDRYVAIDASLKSAARFLNSQCIEQGACPRSAPAA